MRCPRHPVPVGPPISSFPPVLIDLALVVDDAVPAAEVEAALREGAGELLEALRLFDVYTGAPVPAGSRSLAYALTFRAPDRTLTARRRRRCATPPSPRRERTGAALRA